MNAVAFSQQNKECIMLNAIDFAAADLEAETFVSSWFRTQTAAGSEALKHQDALHQFARKWIERLQKLDADKD